MTNDIFGVSGKALQLSEDRAVLLTGNIVNSSTPHYKAKDMDFHKILQNEASNSASSLAVSTPGHIGSGSSTTSESVLYRVPNQSNLDGNTVDEEIERKNFMQNALNYRVNLTFVKNTTDQLRRAIKGE